MTTKDLLITDFSDAVFQNMFKEYFAEIGVKVNDWEGLWAEMNTQNVGNTAYTRACGEEPAGFIQFTTVTLENRFFKESLGLVREFWVAKKFRGQGHGSELLRLAEKYFKDSGINRVVLTAEENEQRFYLNRRYRICESIEAKNGMAVSLKNNPELCEEVKLYRMEKWNKVYGLLFPDKGLNAVSFFLFFV